jgi:DNA-binding transcriptional regulator LsrR (DeoR family)
MGSRSVSKYVAGLAKHSHRNRRGKLPALNAERQASLRRLYFVKKWKQVTLAIHFRIAPSTVSRYLSS